MTPPLATVRVQHDGHVAIAAVQGEIDLSNAREVGEILMHETADTAVIVLDLSAVEYLDSAAVALVVRLGRTLVEAGRDLRVVAPPRSPAANLFRLAPLRGMAVDPTLDEALSALAG